MEEGQFRKAAQALTSEGVADASASLDEMRKKHPAAPIPALPPQPGPRPMQFSSEQVKKAISSFPQGTAPGPSRLRASHLKEAIGMRSQEQNDSTLSAITRVVNLLANGSCPPAVVPFLCGATLIPINKKTGGLRPIAVGEVLRRLVAKCFTFSLAQKAAQLLAPLQVGVSVKGGCESVVHAVNYIVHDESLREEKQILLVDFANAFNSIDREVMLQEVRNCFPELSSWAESCYGHAHPHLFMQEHRLQSCSGVQQGDPLGPLLFAITLQPVLEKIRVECPGLIMNSWYLDDGTLAGNARDIARAIQILEEGTARGLTLNKGKCLMWTGSDSKEPPPPTEGVPKEIPRVQGGFHLLGSPIGPSDFCEATLAGRIDKIEGMLEKLKDLKNSHLEFLLLRSCFSLPKFAFSLRTCSFHKVRKAIRNFDEAQRKTLEEILGGPLTNDQWSQASLPVKMGGMGLRTATSHATAAYLGSTTASKGLVKSIIGNNSAEPIDQQANVDELRSLTDKVGWVTVNDIDVPITQKKLSEAIDVTKKGRLLESMTTDREKARLLSVMTPHSGDWLQVIPSSSLGLRLHSEEFQACAQYRLGLPVYEGVRICPACNLRDADVLGDHSIGCGGGADRIGRHDRLRDAIFSAAQSAALAPRREVSSLIPGSQSRPADVFLPQWSRGRAAAVDITVVSPLQAALVHESARTPGHALQVAEDRKIRQHKQACSDAGIDFIPAAVDTFGQWSSESEELIERIGTFQSRRGVGNPGRIYQKLSITLQKGNASLLLGRDAFYYF
jgi:hypothetical protein